ncbi:MAG: class I SAM-dependent methyltransferase [Actinomycetota bacterium]|jgi:ubiquinone/menaquinone biosynthesis C-methylase UbiE|nr:class I SAM-dependent methyltransferase [Actinomycetota bacterium]
MGFFNWAAPAFHRLADRWSIDDVDRIAYWLRPFVNPNGRLLDLGGGTGALGVRLSSALDANVVVGDPTPQMIRYVPTSDRVSAVLTSAEDIPFADEEFDAVIVSDAFHHFRDQPGAAREMVRVVRSGGGVTVLELDPTGLGMRALVLAEKLLGEPGAFFTPEAMCEFWRAKGVEGTCERVNGPTYRFTGTVK